MIFLPILRDGVAEGFQGTLPEKVAGVLSDTAKLYERRGYSPPWTAFLVTEADVPVGTCAFVGPPREGVVEIAYYTFKGNEGKGIATRMGRHLIEIARKHDPSVVITAHTLPLPGASTRVLEKLGLVLRDFREDPQDGPIWVWRL